MKCLKCGKTIGLLRRGQLILDGCVCYKCFAELGFTEDDRRMTGPAYYHWNDIQYGKAKYDALRWAKAKAYYEFLVQYEDNEKVYKILERYQRDLTDPDDKYDGMTMREIKASDDCKIKHYEYPPLDATVDLIETERDGKPAIQVTFYDGDKERPIGYAPPRKVKRIREILADKDPFVSAELFGGHYMMLKDSGWVETDYSDDLKVRVKLDWSSRITFDDVE